MRLVGPFELLTMDANSIKDLNLDLTCCCRYFHDPPELTTVLISTTDSGFHVGYFRLVFGFDSRFRDDYANEPDLIVSTDSKESGPIDIIGTNIFEAVA